MDRHAVSFHRQDLVRGSAFVVTSLARGWTVLAEHQPQHEPSNNRGRGIGVSGILAAI